MRAGEHVTDERGSQFRVLEEIGAGGQGTAYKVVECGTSRPAVLKQVHAACLSAYPQTIPRMQALARLRLGDASSTLRGVPEAVVAKGCAGYVAPFCSGEPLLDVIARFPGDLVAMTALGAALARAVGIAELRSVAHGDLSPANVLVEEPIPGVLSPALIDWDAAHIKGSAPPPRIGTPLYRAPEIIDGSARPSAMTDRFSLGVMLHEILLARHPWGVRAVDPDDDAAQLDVLRQQDFVTAGDHETAGGVPTDVLGSEIRRMLRRSMSLTPADRPSARRWSEVLRGTLDQLWECPTCTFITRDEPGRSGCSVCGEPATALVVETEAGVRVRLRPPSMLIGRELLGADASVSHRHLVMRRDGYRWLMRHVSRQGTRLLRRRRWIRVPPDEEFEVRPGDTLRLGASTIVRVAML